MHRRGDNPFPLPSDSAGPGAPQGTDGESPIGTFSTVQGVICSTKWKYLFQDERHDSVDSEELRLLGCDKL